MSTPVLTSFGGGELSPLLDRRTDIEKYHTGCKQLENFFVLSQGAATRRPGTEYIDTVKDSDDATRIVEFARSNALSYVLEFGENYIRVFTSGAQVDIEVGDLAAYNAATSYIPGDWVSSGGAAYYNIQAGIGHAVNDTDYWSTQAPYEIWTPWTAAEAFKLKAVQSADTMYIVHPDHEVHKLTTTGAADWTLEKVDFVYQAFKDENIDTEKKMGITVTTANTPSTWQDGVSYPEDALVDQGGTIYKADRDISEYEDYTNPATANAPWTATIATIDFTKGTLVTGVSFNENFTGDDVGKYILIKTPRKDTSITSTLIAASDTSDELAVKGTWNLITHGTWDGTIELQRSYDGGTTWVMARTYSSDSDNNVKDDGEEEVDGVLYRVEYILDDGGRVKVDLNVEDPYNFNIYKIVDYTNAWLVTLQMMQDETAPANSAYPHTSITATYSAWAWGAWGGEYAYPRSIAFYEERLCFGGNADQPLTIWFSKIADYENLTTGVLDTSALIYTLASDKVNAILWMVPHNKLLIGTNGDEWIIGSNKNGEPMTPVNTSAKRQSTYGSEDIQAIAVNNIIFFVQRGGRKVREMAYDYQSELYQSPDMSIMSEHITETGIIDIKFQQNPYPILWCLRTDGVLAAFTYEKEQQVFAWHRHDINGTVESIAVIPNEASDELWVSVERLLTTATYVRYLERFTTMVIPDSIEESWFVDSGLEYDGGDDILVGAAGQTADTPFAFSIAGHGFTDGDKIRVLADPAQPTVAEAFPFLNEVFTVYGVAGAVFKIQNEPGSANWSAADAGHGYNFHYLAFQKVTKTITGLTHLRFNTVKVIGDYTLLPDEVVSAGSEVALDTYVNKALIGLGYTSTLQPMNIESELADGGSQARKKRVAQVVLAVHKSVGFSLITIDDRELEMEAPFRIASDPMDETTPLYSGYKKLKYEGGYDEEAGVIVTQDVPLPLTILMIQFWLRTYN